MMNGALFVHTEVKQQDDMLDELEWRELCYNV